MINIRKENKTLIYGSYELILEDHEKIYAYTRIMGEERFVIIVNLSHDNVTYSYNIDLSSDGLLLSNYIVEKHGLETEFDLRPYEARIYKVIK